MAHKGDVARVMEEFVHGTKDAGGTYRCGMHAGIDVPDDVERHCAYYQPGGPGRSVSRGKESIDDRHYSFSSRPRGQFASQRDGCLLYDFVSSITTSAQSRKRYLPCH
jgi:hypothetical protein